MRVIISLASSCGVRVRDISDMSLGSLVPKPQHELYKITIYEWEPESHDILCNIDCKTTIDPYINMRKIYG